MQNVKKGERNEEREREREREKERERRDFPIALIDRK